jgi:cyclopropane-fatty-acyl-phospholipid synthase
LSAPASPAPSHRIDHERSILADVIAGYAPRDFAVRFSDGSRWEAEGEARFTLALAHPGSLRRLLARAKILDVWEAYTFGDIDVEGDLASFFRLAVFLGGIRRSKDEARTFAERLSSLPEEQRSAQRDDTAVRRAGEVHSIARDRAAISHHYDLPTSFFKLWLDPFMQYTCAYFHDAEEDLGAAQLRKMEYLCRKLALRPGQRLLDVGCGWGGFARYASARHGVHTVGCTISRSQYASAVEELREAGLQSRCQIRLQDYREVDEPSSYDAISIIGVLEHFGEENVPVFFARAWDLLRPGGRLLVQTITSSQTEPPPPSWQLVARYVFPDGDPAPLPGIVQAAELAAFEVRDVESLREHYARTVDHWFRRLDAHAEEARRLTSEQVYRAWRVYLVGARLGFEAGANGLYQLLLVKPDAGRSGVPLTRHDWYTSDVGSAAGSVPGSKY